MPRKTLAVWIVALGLSLGLLGNILFYNKMLGISFPLFIFVAALVLLAATRPAQTRVHWRNLWPVIPMLLFAIMVAVRAETTITLLNVSAALALGGLALRYLPLPQPLDEAPLEEHLTGVLEAGMFAAFAAVPEIGDSWGWLRERSWQGRTVVAVVRGLAIAVPIILVFTVLLCSADAVFASVVEDAWRLLAFNPDGALIDQALLTLSIGWLSAGALAYGLARRTGPARSDTVAADADSDEADAYFAYGDEAAVPMESDEPAAPTKRKTRPMFRLGMIESGIVLGLVDLLFGLFVLIQLAYFFGGEAFLSERGLTYSQYARRGFFELAAVSVLTLGLVLWLNHITVRVERRERRIFIGLSIVVVALTSVMLVSAAQRMYLYEQAYGFTHLRVFTHVFMLWLGILFVFFLLTLFEVKPRIFTLGVLLTSIGYLATLNGMNVDLYIAERNIDRFYEGYALDLGFLGGLSTDAVPAVTRLYADNQNNPDAREWAGQWLAGQWLRLDAQKDATFFSLNLSRQQSWAALETIHDELPDYDPSFFWSYERGYFDIYAATPDAISR
ncbi:MAG: DUF4173 domain-containing protein [Anaerolineae bacterium]|nr:DUF4173 domain-containing protein [Anaerolineae bacterium]